MNIAHVIVPFVVLCLLDIVLSDSHSQRLYKDLIGERILSGVLVRLRRLSVKPTSVISDKWYFRAEFYLDSD